MTNEENDRFNGLSNQEILFIYYKLDKYLTALDKNLDKNIVTKQVETPMGVATSMKEVSSKHVIKFRESIYYKTVVSIVEKLRPIAKIIEECDSSVDVEHFK